MLFGSILLVLHLSLLVPILSVSPCSPSHSLAKNALSSFIQDLISQASSSPSSSSNPQPSSSLGPLRSSSSFCAYSVAASVAFVRKAPLSSILEAATWGSASVFTSFYLKEVLVSSGF